MEQVVLITIQEFNNFFRFDSQIMEAFNQQNRRTLSLYEVEHQEEEHHDLPQYSSREISSDPQIEESLSIHHP